jgi:molybdopterin-biosynthesis enzyme MoeA-like protein
VHTFGMPEGIIAAGLTEIQNRHPDIDLGSYPFYRPTGNGVTLVAKGTSAAEAEEVIADVTALIVSLGRTPIPGEPPE